MPTNESLIKKSYKTVSNYSNSSGGVFFINLLFVSITQEK